MRERLFRLLQHVYVFFSKGAKGGWMMDERERARSVRKERNIQSPIKVYLLLILDEFFLLIKINAISKIGNFLAL
jgi:hypothetical protein